jgi:hypothetical protein
MITKKEFTDFIKSYQTFYKAFERIEEALMGRKYICSNLYESDWYESVGKMLDIFIDSHFTEEGADWVNYYLWEDVDDKAAYIKQDKDIFNEEKEIRFPLDTLDELWDFLLTNKKLYFKNV